MLSGFLSTLSKYGLNADHHQPCRHHVVIDCVSWLLFQLLLSKTSLVIVGFLDHRKSTQVWWRPRASSMSSSCRMKSRHEEESLWEANGRRTIAITKLLHIFSLSKQFFWKQKEELLWEARIIELVATNNNKNNKNNASKWADNNINAAAAIMNIVNLTADCGE